MASGFKTYTIVSGTEKDLDEVFKLRVAGDPEFSGNSGFKTSDGLDLIKRYYPSSGDEDQYQIASGFRVQALNLDFSQIFRSALYAGGAPTIVQNPIPVGTLVAGQSFSILVDATGQEPLTYQWYKNGVAIGGEISFVLTNPSVSAGDAGIYWCVVTNAVGSVQSSSFTLTVQYPPEVVSMLPATGSTYNVGDAIAIVCTANPGVPAALHYDWYRNDSALPLSNLDKYTGVAADTLSFNFTLDDYGKTYRCVVRNAVGEDYEPVSYNVQFAPGIFLNIYPSSANEGGTLTFAVVATGNPAPSFQWYKDNVPVASGTVTPIPGSLPTYSGGSSYELTNVTTADRGAYKCVATNAVGSYTFGPVDANVYANPSIFSSPSNLTEAAGSGPWGLNCTATGDGTLNFTWYKNGILVAGPREGSISALADEHVIGVSPPELGLQPEEAGDYYCVVTNSYGGTPATSATATVTVT